MLDLAKQIRACSVILAAFLAAALANPHQDAAEQPKRLDFEQRVGPILIRNCLGCHNSSQAEGHLDLTTAETAMKGGESGPVIVAGKPDESYLIERVRSHEMPPPDKAKPLSNEDIDALAAWIRDGAAWPAGRTLSESDLTTDRRAGRDWWSWQPVRRMAIPLGAPTDATRGPIDPYIIARLTQAGLVPSAEADRKTLIRRLYFDLVGLPPAPEELAIHAADLSPDAVDRLVDRLLASPRYGERWARHWLDVVRFGETNGYEVNTPRDNAWPYRDYVIRALNADTPYDNFIRQQLIGDQLGVGAATGFIVGGPKDQVGNNTIEGQRQQRSDDLDDMLSTTASAFLGLTVNCAKCHNHKFDPIAQADYFRLAAMFAGVNHGDRPVESIDFERRKQEVPKIQRQLDQIALRVAALEQKIDEIGQPLAVVPAGGDAGSASTTQKRPPLNAVKNVDRFAPTAARFIRFTVEAANLYEPCIDELEVYAAGMSPAAGSGAATNVALAASGAKATASGVYNNGREPIHQLAHVNDGRYGNGRSWISNEIGRGWVQIELAKPAMIDRVVWGRDREEKFRDRLATRYTIEVAVEPGRWTTVATSVDRQTFDPQNASDPRTPDVLPADEAAEYARLKARRAALEAAVPKPTIPAYAGSFTAAPPEMRRLHRGDVMQPREVVGPGVIEGVGAPVKLEPSADDALRRRTLADWIADPRNPLTARVLVNRLWHYHFGRGLVATPSNFGFLGGKPTHPELLDWLAAELVHRQWSIKAMHRAIVTSAAYRQSSADDSKSRDADAGCQLLWRFPPRRLEAEAIRDAMLSAAGTLDFRMGGPGYAVFEPNDNYVRVYVPKKRYGPEQWRRMVYQTKPRMQQDATFGQFDCPEASGVVAARNVSTTALQALNLLNSPFVIQQADQFAKRLAREAPSDVRGQAHRAFAIALGREPTADEAAAAERLIADHGLAALCRAIVNASEFTYVN
jgi:hypothetical protein